MKPRTVVLLFGAAALALLSHPVSALQDPVAARETAPPLVIRVGVDLIQIDASVTDKEGRPVRDLRPEDFTIEIDGKKQPVSNAMFFEGGPGSGVGAPADASLAASSPDRTLLFLFDDLNASFGSMYKAKRAMKGFAAGWDFREARVGLRSTSEDGKTVLLSRSPERFDEAISKLRYSIRSDKGASSEPDFLRQTPGERGITASLVGSPAISTGSPAISMGNPALSRANYDQRIYSLLSTINALRSVPGRKAVVLVSEGFTLGRDRDNLGVDSPFDALFAESWGLDDSVLRMIIEVANRASVVIYTIDPSGLLAGNPGADVARAPSVAARQSEWFSRVGTQQNLARLAEDTGGIAIYNQNDLKRGFNEVVNDQRAYYLIGFEPPKASFEKSSGRPKYHEIKLKVSRPDVQVRTRAGFYGVTDKEVNEHAPLMVSPEH